VAGVTPDWKTHCGNTYCRRRLNSAGVCTVCDPEKTEDALDEARKERAEAISDYAHYRVRAENAEAERDKARKELRNIGLARQDYNRMEAERDRLARLIWQPRFDDVVGIGDDRAALASNCAQCGDLAVGEICECERQ